MHVLLMWPCNQNYIHSTKLEGKRDFFLSPTENAEETFFSLGMHYWLKLSYEKQATPDTALCFVYTKLIKRTRSDEVFSVFPHVWSTSGKCALVQKESRAEWYRFYCCTVTPRFIETKLILQMALKCLCELALLQNVVMHLSKALKFHLEHILSSEYVTKCNGR